MDVQPLSSGLSRPQGSRAASLHIQASTFGNDARITHINVESMDSPLFPQDSGAFLSALSLIDPRNDIYLFDEHAETRTDTVADAFKDLFKPETAVGMWLDSTGHVLWVHDDTGTGHSLFTTQLIRHLKPTIMISFPIIAYFFCNQSTEDPVTAKTIIAGLVYMLLVDPLSQRIMLGAFQTRYGIQLMKAKEKKDSSEFWLLAEILKRALWQIHKQEGGRALLIIDGLQHCTTDKYGIGVSHLLHIINSTSSQEISQSHQWVLSGNLSSSMQRQLKAPVVSQTLDYTHLAAAFGLSEAIKTIMRTGSILEEAQRTRMKIAQWEDDSLSWFRYSGAVRDWMQPSSPGSDPKFLWYRRKLQSGLTPSNIGLHVIANKDQAEQPPSLGAYFSFSAVLDAVPNHLFISDNRTIHPAQALWCIFTQLLHQACPYESSLAKHLFQFSSPVKEGLVAICTALNTSRREMYSNPHPDTQLYTSILRLGKHHLSKIEDCMINLTKSFRERQSQFILVFDCLELLRPKQCTEFLASLSRFGDGVRVLLCVNDTLQSTARDKIAWMKLMSTSQVVDESSEFEECIKSLKFDDMHYRRDQIPDAWPKTNQWLWENNVFRKWMESGNILWIYGKAGSGKSVLAKSIRQHLQLECQNDRFQSSWIVCDWFYTARGRDIGIQHASMLRVLIFDILNSHNSAFDTIKSRYRARIDKNESEDWSLSELREIFTTLAASPSTPETFVVIDALDESDSRKTRESDRIELFKMFNNLGSMEKGRLRFVLLSRPEPDISQSLINWPRIDLGQHNEDDISTLVEFGVIKLRSTWLKAKHSSAWVYNVHSSNTSESTSGDILADDEESSVDENYKAAILEGPAGLSRESEVILNEIRINLKNKADGVIIWACLVIRQLRREIKYNGFTPRQLLNTLDTLPTEIEKYYQYFVERLKTSESLLEQKETRKILQWIVGSRRWTRLELRHLWEAMAIPDGTERNKTYTGTTENKYDTEGKDLNKFCHTILHRCGPLVEILEDPEDPTTERQVQSKKAGPTRTVQLSHQTVNTFLQDKTRSGDFHVDQASAERLVISKSYRYLGISLNPSMSPLTFAGDMVDEKHPLLALEESLSELPGRPMELLATQEYLKIMPFSEFALRIVRHFQPEEFENFEVFNMIDEKFPDFEAHFLIYWAVDMCFTSTYSGTVVEDFVRVCCLNGRKDVLETFFELLRKYIPKYAEKKYEKSIVHGRDFQIISGAVEAFVHIGADHEACHVIIAKSLYDLYEEGLHSSLEVCSSRAILPEHFNSETTHLDFIGRLLSQMENSTHACGPRCRKHRHRIHQSTGCVENIPCHQIIQAIKLVTNWIAQAPRFGFEKGLSHKMVLDQIELPIYVKSALENFAIASGLNTEDPEFFHKWGNSMGTEKKILDLLQRL